MEQRVGNYQRRVNTWLLVAFTITGITGTLVWWALGQFSSLDNSLAAAIAGVAAVIVGWSWSVFLSKKLSQPIVEIVEALDHVGPGSSPKRAPKPSELVKPIVSQIYELATSAKSLTTDLEGQRAFLDAAMGLLPVGVLIFNSEQQTTYVNPLAAELLGHSSQELEGLNRSDVLDWLFQTDENYDYWLDQSRANDVHSQHFWERVALIKTDGERLIGDLAAHYEKDETHDIETIVVFIDRTKEYIADEAQLDFVAVAAHELRGPITVIRGYLDVFLDELGGSFTVEQRNLLQKMTVSAEMLSLYVNNILNVARIDQQEMKLHIVKSDWRQTIKEIYSDLFLRAQAHSRVLQLELPDEPLPEVGIDRVSITEVVNNLVDNAIKYSPEGGEIIIRVKVEEGLVETTVEDKGIGIPDSVIGNLFKKFYRSHRTKAGVSGTGLGLYLCKSIIDAHGGNIWVRSRVGEGSTFGFDLPTYNSIAESIKKGEKDGGGIKRSSHGWIKNHKMYRR